MNSKQGAEVVFLKLGGSLISDKSRRGSFRRSVARRMAREIRGALEARPAVRLVLAHGGGSLAHAPARRFRTRDGLAGGGGWKGFGETRLGVLEMNRRVLRAFRDEGVYPVLIPPSSGAIARDGVVRTWNLDGVRQALGAGRVALIHGDCILDLDRGFTIASTEELFAFLAPRLRPQRVILACDVEGVYVSEPDGARRARPVPIIDRRNIAEIRKTLPNPASMPRHGRRYDVTGGMASKVEGLFALCRRMRGLDARIVSGMRPGIVRAVLLGAPLGTAVRY